MSEDFFVQENDRPTEAEIVFHSTTSKKHLSGYGAELLVPGVQVPSEHRLIFLAVKQKRIYEVQ